MVTIHLNSSNNVALPAFSICFDIEPKSALSLKADTIFRMFFEDIEEREQIVCSLYSSKLSMKAANNTNRCEDMSPIVESIIYGSNLKCLTFLSRLKLNQMSDYSRNRFQSNYLTWSFEDYSFVKIDITFPKLYSEKLNKRAFLYLHNDNELPVDGFKMSKMIPGYDYIISYNMLVEKRSMECEDYEDEEKRSSEFLSHYDCVDKCLIDIYRNNCQCLPIDTTMRRDMVHFLGSFCPDNGCESVDMNEVQKCKNFDRCKPDCTYEMIQFSTESIPAVVPVKIVEKPKPAIDDSGLQTYDANSHRPYEYLQNETPNDSSSNKISILVQPNHLPVTIYQHIEPSNSFEVLFKILLLASVWLGLSVFTIIWIPFDFILRFLSNRLFSSVNCKTKPLIDIKP